MLLYQLVEVRLFELEKFDHDFFKELLNVLFVTEDEKDLLLKVMYEFGHALLFDRDRVSVHKVVEERLWKALLFLKFLIIA